MSYFLYRYTNELLRKLHEIYCALLELNADYSSIFPILVTFGYIVSLFVSRTVANFFLLIRRLYAMTNE